MVKDIKNFFLLKIKSCPHNGFIKELNFPSSVLKCHLGLASVSICTFPVLGKQVQMLKIPKIERIFCFIKVKERIKLKNIKNTCTSCKKVVCLSQICHKDKLILVLIKLFLSKNVVVEYQNH